MGTIKAVCIKQHSQLAGVLDMGDEVEITSILSTEDVMEEVKVKNPNGNGTLIVSRVKTPKGNYEGFTFVSKNGKTYSDHTIHLCIGYFRMEKLFKKI